MEHKVFGTAQALLVGGSHSGKFITVKGDRIQLEKEENRPCLTLGTHVMQREQSPDITFTVEDYVKTDHRYGTTNIFVLAGMSGADLPSKLLAILVQKQSDIEQLENDLDLYRRDRSY
ncbi:hypothetical protein [Vibrio phage R01]|nr:hypothetical protein [Vibrio phage R01]